MISNIDRIRKKAEKEINEVEDWLLKLSQLRLSFYGTEQYSIVSNIISMAELTVRNDPDYWKKVNQIIQPIFELNTDED
jgi:hypothetical protein